MRKVISLILIQSTMSNSILASDFVCRNNKKTPEKEMEPLRIFYINGMNVKKSTFKKQYLELRDILKTRGIKVPLEAHYNSNGFFDDAKSWTDGEGEISTAKKLVTGAVLGISSKKDPALRGNKDSLHSYFGEQLARAAKIFKRTLFDKNENLPILVSELSDMLQPKIKKIPKNSIFIGHSMGSIISDAFVKNAEVNNYQAKGIYFGSQVKRPSVNYFKVNDTRDGIGGISIIPDLEYTECHDFNNYIKPDEGIDQMYLNCGSKGSASLSNTIFSTLNTYIIDNNSKENFSKYYDNSKGLFNDIVKSIESVMSEVTKYSVMNLYWMESISRLLNLDIIYLLDQGLTKRVVLEKSLNNIKNEQEYLYHELIQVNMFYKWSLVGKPIMILLYIISGLRISRSIAIHLEKILFLMNIAETEIPKEKKSCELFDAKKTYDRNKKKAIIEKYIKESDLKNIIERESKKPYFFN